ncbi:CHAD domain-containing protein [Sphingomonas sp.]|uniref:CYTH and CHAD domain-containing protein n=1 Tax=Sphingomonas sp. TaxID=28214 RepID=UPI003B0052EC
MSEHQEVELKLEFAEGDAAAVASLPAWTAAPAEARRLVATYYDTPARELRDAGFTLRVRSDGDRHVQTIKAAGTAAGLFVRPEWESEVDDARPRLDRLAGPMAPLVTPDLLDRLAPAFATEVERAVRIIEHAGATIEVAIDRGVVGTGTREERLHEIELELKAGTPAALFSLARTIAEAAPVRLGMLSKAERGFRLLDAKPGRPAKAEPIAFPPGTDAARAFRLVAQSCLRQFRLNEAALLAGDDAPAVLHQARVGLRRLRSALSLFAELYQADEAAARIAEGLRASAVVLGEARDIDVLTGRLDEVEPALDEARTSARAHVLAELRGARHRELMIDLAEWLAIGPWLSDPASAQARATPVSEAAGVILDRFRKRLKRRGARLAKIDDEARHRVRIVAKKLRYATEFFASVADTPKRQRRHERFLMALERLQEHLGELNDAATAPLLARRHGLAPPPLADRDKAIAKAADAFDELVDARRFWR